MVANLTLSKRRFFCQLPLTLKSTHSHLHSRWFIYLYKGKDRFKETVFIEYDQNRLFLILLLFAQHNIGQDTEDQRARDSGDCNAAEGKDKAADARDQDLVGMQSGIDGAEVVDL